MSTIHDFIGSAERHAADMQQMVDASDVQDIVRWVSEAQRMFENSGVPEMVHRAVDVQQMFEGSGLHDLFCSAERHALIVQSAIDSVEATKVSIERTRSFAEICIQLKWPPPWHMPARVIDRITVAYRAGRLTPEETARIFASFYTPERIREFGQRWADCRWLAHRMTILNEALGNHIDGRHHSAICLLLPQIEGVLREALGAKPNRMNIVRIIRGYELATAAGRFFADVVMETFDPDSAAPIPELSRHAILHGKATDFGTLTHSLKVILMADIILSSIEESRTHSAEDGPSEEAENAAPE